MRRLPATPLPDLSAELRAELAAAAAAPLHAARMLPLEVYRSAAVLALEHARVLDDAWHCVARSADLPHPGDHLVGLVPSGASTSGHREVLVVRGDDGRLRAFDNVCVHRGSPLATGCASAARLTCPYHGWTYRLDGQLIGAPYMHRAPGGVEQIFEPGDHRLHELAIDEWEGFVLVSTAAVPEPIAPRLSGLAEVLGRFRLAGYVPVHQQVDEWQTNWKLLVENFLDTYHVFKVHRATFGTGSDSPLNTTMFPGTDAWTYHVATERTEVAHPDNTALEGPWRRAVVLAAVFPTLVMQVQPDFCWHLQISPLGTDRVRLRWDVSVAPEVLAAQVDPEHYVADLLALLRAVNAEDQPVIEGVRRGCDSPQFARAPLSEYEANVVDFDRHVARRLAV